MSLVEILVILVIIAILSTLVVPSVVSMLRGSGISQAEQLLTQQISLARQRAMTKNRTVEIRFYRHGENGEPGNSEWQYRSLQIFEAEPSGIMKSVDRIQALPPNAILSSNPALSTILDPASPYSRRREPAALSLPTIGMNNEFTRLRFLPNGSTDLPVSLKWFCTLYASQDQDSGSTPPSNFATIEVEPLTASVTVYRPDS